MKSTRCAAALLLCLVAFHDREARAHEVDQFAVPTGTELTDLGELWNEMFHEAVRKGVRKLNGDIERAQDIPIAELRRLRLAYLHSPDTVAWNVRQQLGTAWYTIESLEWNLRYGEARNRFRGTLLYKSSVTDGIYSHFPVFPDPRQINRMVLMRCSTIKVHDTYLGTDKVGHFVGMGHMYYLSYRASRGMGQTHEAALRDATQIARLGPLSESGFLGMISTGVYSNSDMVANYLGMKFFINLTEPVALHGATRPPMLARDGDFWRIQPHVGNQGEYMALFISPHLDEVLNPNLYEWGMREPMRAAIRQRSNDLVNWYAGNDPAKRQPSYFDLLLAENLTYYGEDYGHVGDENSLVVVGKTCFEDPPAGAPVSLVKATKQAESAAGRYARNTARPGTPRPAPQPVVAPVVHSLRDGQLTVQSQGPDVSVLQASSDFAIAVSNPGPDAALDVAVQLTVPSGLVVTTLETPADYNAAQRTLTWRLPQVAAGELYELRFKARSVAAGQQVQRVEVRSGAVVVAQNQHSLEVRRSVACEEAPGGPVSFAVSDQDAE